MFFLSFNKKNIQFAKQKLVSKIYTAIKTLVSNKKVGIMN